LMDRQSPRRCLARSNDGCSNSTLAGLASRRVHHGHVSLALETGRLLLDLMPPPGRRPFGAAPPNSLVSRERSEERLRYRASQRLTTNRWLIANERADGADGSFSRM